MKGIIRKTGEEITIVSYHSLVDRNETLDYVSYIDSDGNEHPCESMNLFWDVEVVHPNEEILRSQLELYRIQVENAKKTVEAASVSVDRMPTKVELIAANILGGLAANSRISDDGELVGRAIRMAYTLLKRLS